MQISVDNGQHVDALGRIKFARHLLNLAERVDVKSSGVVIGLEGVWGSGKTSVLNSLDGILEEREESQRPILIRFNPWMLSGTSDLVSAMLVQVAAELPSAEATGFVAKNLARFRKVEKPGAAAAALISYAGLLGAVKYLAPAANYLIPGAGIALDAAGSAFADAAKGTESVGKTLTEWKRSPKRLSLIESRKRVEKQLAQMQRRVVVIVDDLDRLPPHELASMIQAVKAVADFPNVVYLLAFDPDVAQAGVKDALGVDDGRAFLEKVIQVPLRLPEVPAAKLTVHAVSRFRSVFSNKAISPNEVSDLETAWGVAAALMKSPRDIERLRTCLLVASPVLIGEVNMADVVILEAMSLKHPEVITWLKENVDTVFGGGLYQFDESLRTRGEINFGSDVYGLEGEERRKQAEERANAWTAHLPTAAQTVGPAKNAMGFLFDNCRKRWGSSIERSGYRRVQQFRYWYRWRCFHDHQERWPVGEIEGYLRRPTELLQSEIVNSKESFLEICQHICDIGLESLTDSDAVGLVDAFVALERSFGSETLIDSDLGFGPLQALVVGLRLDTKDRRLQAIMRLIDTASVWLSCCVLFKAQRDLAKRFDEERLSVERYLLPTKEMFEESVEKWWGIAKAHLTPKHSAIYSEDLCPYTLLCWMASLKMDEGALPLLAEKFISDGRDRMQMFFSSLADHPRQESFPIEVRWAVLPPPAFLHKAATESPGFSQSHSRLMELIVQRAQIKS